MKFIPGFAYTPKRAYDHANEWTVASYCNYFTDLDMKKRSVNEPNEGQADFFC